MTTKLDELDKKISQLEDAISLVGEELARKLLGLDQKERLQKAGLGHHVDDELILKARRQMAREDQVKTIIERLMRLIAADPVGAEIVIDSYLALGSRGSNPPRSILQPSAQERAAARARILKQWGPTAPPTHIRIYG